LKLTENTVGKRIKDLKERGYIVQEGKYYLVPKTDYYTLLPKDTLDFLLCYLQDKDKLIKLYVVLYDYWNKRKSFTISELHMELGYKMDKNGKPQSRNSAYIRELLIILKGAELIDYEIKSGRNDKGAPIDIYHINFVRSNLPDFYRESYKRLVESGEITPEWEKLISSKI
jgi:DNA-binding Lrp family transcriptional regulator